VASGSAGGRILSGSLGIAHLIGIVRVGSAPPRRLVSCVRQSPGCDQAVPPH